jgi:hypothetical protein
MIKTKSIQQPKKKRKNSSLMSCLVAEKTRAKKETNRKFPNQ